MEWVDFISSLLEVIVSVMHRFPIKNVLVFVVSNVDFFVELLLHIGAAFDNLFLNKSLLLILPM
jgi:hypothetical protein